MELHVFPILIPPSHLPLHLIPLGLPSAPGPLYVAVQFLQHHLLKRLSFLHCIFLPPLSKIRYPEVCGFISGLSQNLWDAAKAVQREIFIAIQYYLKRQEKHQIENVT